MASQRVYLMVPPPDRHLRWGMLSRLDGETFPTLFAVFRSSCVGMLVQLLAEWLGWPFTVSGAVAVALILGTVFLWKILFPPACAVGLLPFLLPREELFWYPVLVDTGCGIVLLATRWLFPVVARLLERETGKAAPARTVCSEGTPSPADADE